MQKRSLEETGEPDEASAESGATAAEEGSSSTASSSAASSESRKRPANKLTQAQWWYYLDEGEKKQGPFFPGVMRDWFDQGYFPDTTKVAASFMGEIPRQGTFDSIASLFPDKESAFRPAAGIALYPPEAVAPNIVEITEVS